VDLERLWKPFRATISFLADVSGALVAVAAAAGLIVAGIAGAGIAALNVLDQPYFTLLVAGLALGAAGLAVHLLGGRLTPSASTRSETTTPPMAVPTARTPTDSTPNQQAAALTRAYQEQFGDVAAQKLREASRRVRGELLDNRLHAERVLGGEPFDSFKISRSKWLSHEGTLIAHSDPAPYGDSSQAYRELDALKDSPRQRDDFDVDAGQPLETDLQSAIEAIDNAVETLDGLNNVSQPLSRTTTG
jgi:hypothetical protein